MTGILALDLATRTGYAAEIDGLRKSGAVSFDPHKHEAGGWRYVRFNAWLYETWKGRGLKMVVTERALPNHYQRATAEIAFGFATRVEEFCARNFIPLHTVHNATLKKFATGHGKAVKGNMLKFAQILKPGVNDDNEADALWLLEYANKVIIGGRL